MKKEAFCIVDTESRSRTPIDRGPANYFADPDAGLICRRGSGTTLLAALQNGRNAYGVEISSKYCEMIKARLVREVK